MATIVLATINARYIHSAFGLRYLRANLGELESQSTILEFEIHDRVLDMSERILKENPTIVGLGVYIWNVRQTEALVAAIKSIRPDLNVIVGGPEISYETESQKLSEIADFVVTGEADHEFRNLCHDILSGQSPTAKIRHATPPELEFLKLPYYLYSEKDLKERVVYVEASRGCPFTCEFCLSSLEIPVRQADLELFLSAMSDLYLRGARQFKFVDRTFNLNISIGSKILQFFLDRMSPELFVHFEMVPDRLPEQLRALITKFPQGSLQFEVGIQTFNPTVAGLISRRQNYVKLEENLIFLRDKSGVHVHADLIAGLPGEDVASFAAGFDRLLALGPQEIQVGILKRLRGTPIIRHDAEWQMCYNPEPPYELLQNRLITFVEMQALSRFARFWDLFSNSGNFKASLPLLWSNRESAFAEFLTFSEWIYSRTGKRSAFSLRSLAELLFVYFTEIRKFERRSVGESIISDFARRSATELPKILQEFQPAHMRNTQPMTGQKLPRRQARHAGLIDGNRLEGMNPEMLAKLPRNRLS